MRLATRLPRIPIILAALVFAITPLADPLLVALAVVSAGLLLAYRCAADLCAAADETLVGDTVFRHDP